MFHHFKQKSHDCQDHYRIYHLLGDQFNRIGKYDMRLEQGWRDATHHVSPSHTCRDGDTSRLYSYSISLPILKHNNEPFFQL